MGLITFNIENNYITCDTTYIVSDNTDYKAKCVFDKDWDGNAYITWLFVYEDKTFKQYICSKTDTISIPKINGTPYIYVGCVSGDQRTTNHVALRVIQSVTELADEERPEIDSDAYDELMDILDEQDSRLDALESTITDKYTKAQTDTLLNGKVDKVTGKGLSTNDYTTADKSKVDAIPSNPKYTDTVYDDTAIKQQINGKVDKVTGKGLSTNDYTNSDKSKVSNIPDNPKYTDTVYDDTDIKNDLSDLQSVVDDKANTADVYNKSTIDTKLSAKQNTLTDADKQSITKTGLTTGDAWTDAECTLARDKIQIGKGYNLIADVVFEEDSALNLDFGREYRDVLVLLMLPRQDTAYNVTVQCVDSYDRSSLYTYLQYNITYNRCIVLETTYNGICRLPLSHVLGNYDTSYGDWLISSSIGGMYTTSGSVVYYLGDTNLYAKSKIKKLKSTSIIKNGTHIIVYGRN